MKKAAASVSSRMVWPWVLACRDLGLDPQLEFARFGLSEGQLRDSEVRLSHATAQGLIQRLIEHSGRADLCLLAAREVERGFFDLLDLAVRTSDTLGDAIDRLVAFFPLLDEGVELYVRRGPAQTDMGLVALAGCELLPAYVEFIPAMLLLAARRETGVENFVADEVCFTHPAPGDVSPYRALFGGDVCFGEPEMRVAFPSRALAFPMLRANAQQQRAAEAALLAPLRKVGS